MTITGNRNEHVEGVKFERLFIRRYATEKTGVISM